MKSPLGTTMLTQSLIHKIRFSGICACFCASGIGAWAGLTPVAAPAGQVPSDYQLTFSDEFEGAADSWSKQWIADAQAHKHILSSRWPENVSMQNGQLSLLNRQETRAGQDWTSGSVSTKQKFRYGYFECRYRYGAAPGLNNSFWLMNQGVSADKIKSGEVTVFELDINEGHYPNKIATNIHRWSPHHTSDSRVLQLGAEHFASIPLEIPVTTDALRIIVRDTSRTSISEIRAFAPTKEGYPTDVDAKGIPLPSSRPNLLTGAKAEATGKQVGDFRAEKTIDGVISNSSRWVVDPVVPGEKTLTLTLPGETTIGCVQIKSGWLNKESWESVPCDYTLQYKRGSQWVDIFNSKSSSFLNLSADFNTYGLLWSEQELVFFFNGKEIRREPNKFAHHPATLYLSSAVIHWAGPVTKAIDGTRMEVDYVRVWQRPAAQP